MTQATYPLHRSAPTQYVDVGGIRTAFRRLGPDDGIPLVLLQHFTGTMDNWDPRVTDALATRRPVILFDNAGVGASGGPTPDSVAAMTTHALAFLDALGLAQVDLLGFSLGSFIAQEIAVRRPALARNLILAGGCPSGHGAGTFRAVVAAVAGKTPAATLLQLFFTPTAASQRAGNAFLERLAWRDEHGGNPPAQVFAAQYRAIEAWCETPDPGGARLQAIAQPVLVVQGSADTMFPPAQSVALFAGLPDAQLSLYPDAGHGSLFQHADLFVEQADYFLRTH